VSEFTARIEAGLHRHFEGTPVAIAWAMRDPAFTARWLEELWLRTFPEARVLRLEDAGHYLQEDAHERIVPELLRFLATTGR
jgi:pimeloyl-ACP methyl ester carboxylesterase